MTKTLLIPALAGLALAVSAPAMALPAAPLNAQVLSDASDVHLAAARNGRGYVAPRVLQPRLRWLPPSPCRRFCRR